MVGQAVGVWSGRLQGCGLAGCRSVVWQAAGVWYRDVV